MYQWRWATGSDPQHPLDIYVLLQEQWGGQGDLWGGQGDPDPHNHGDTNIHSVYMLLEEHMHYVAMKWTTGSLSLRYKIHYTFVELHQNIWLMLHQILQEREVTLCLASI